MLLASLTILRRRRRQDLAGWQGFEATGCVRRSAIENLGQGADLSKVESRNSGCARLSAASAVTEALPPFSD
jgi:hypothetical protein